MEKSRFWLILGAIAAIAMGLWPMLAALGVIPASDDSFGAPRWVVFLASGIFVTCGAWALTLGLAGEALAKTTGLALGVTMMFGFALIANGMAFGAGAASCSGGISARDLGLARGIAEHECRVAFGFGAALLNLMLLRGLGAWWQFCDPASRPARLLSRVLGRGLVLMLLPMVLLVLFIA